MIDKGRAKLADTLGDVVHPCPVDQTCLTRLRVSPEAFLAVLAEAETDADVLAGLRELGIPSADEARFDPIAVEDELQAKGFGLTALKVDELPYSNIAHELVGSGPRRERDAGSRGRAARDRAADAQPPL